MLHVTGFKHYLYVPAPIGFSEHNCDSFKMYLDSQVGQSAPTIHSVNMVLRENIYGFQGNQQNPYIKVTVTDPKYINQVRKTIEEGRANWKGMWKAAEDKVLTFDSLQYILRFMVDCKVSGEVSPRFKPSLMLSRFLGCHG